MTKMVEVHSMIMILERFTREEQTISPLCSNIFLIPTSCFLGVMSPILQRFVALAIRVLLGFFFLSQMPLVILGES